VHLYIIIIIIIMQNGEKKGGRILNDIYITYIRLNKKKEKILPH
jgi:hypothetical protein